MNAGSEQPPSARRVASAIVSGATGTLGEAIVAALCERGARIGVMDTDHDVVAALSQRVSGRSPFALPVDYDPRDTESLEIAVSKLFAELREIDLLVHVVKAVDVRPFVQTPEDSLAGAVTQNLTVYYHLCQAMVAHMIMQESGCVVSVVEAPGSSGGAWRTTDSAVAGAVVGMTRALAAEFEGEHIAFNAILCDNVDTPEFRSALRRLATLDNTPHEQHLADAARAAPGGRLTSPEEVAKVVIELAEKGGGTAGEVIRVGTGAL